MSKEGEAAAGHPSGSRRLLLPALLAGSFLVLLAVALSPSTGAASNVSLEWQYPLSDSHHSGTVELVVQASGSVTNISSVTFLHRGTGDWMEIGEGKANLSFAYTLDWETGALSDGDYELMANASLDDGGNVTEVLTGIHVDNTIPALVFLTPQSSTRLNGLFDVLLEGDPDVVAVDLYVDLGPGSGIGPLGSATRVAGTTNWTYPWDTTGIGENENVGLIATGRDMAGNERSISILNLHVDNFPPVAELILPPDNATLDGYYRLRGNTSEQHLASVYFEWRTAAGSWTRAGNASWNRSLQEWVLFWNTYEVGEHVGAKVRFVVEDDLGQRGHSVAHNITIADLPPQPTFTSPEAGAHLTGRVEVWVWSSNDTVQVSVEYWSDRGWTVIGDAVRKDVYIWYLEWQTTESLHETSLKAKAMDGSSKVGTVTLEGLEVDNTEPALRILLPKEEDLNLYGTVLLLAMSDRDTVNLTFHYLEGEEWRPCGEAEYDPDNNRWELVWEVARDVYVEDSVLRASATDEVGLVGVHLLENRIIGIEPGDEAPTFLPEVPREISFPEDGNYSLNLTGYVTDDDVASLKTWVTGELAWLFYVDGENQTGSLDLEFVPLPQMYGTATVQVFIEDPAGQRDSHQMSVRIWSVDDAPYFWSSPPDLYVHPDVPYIFDYRPYVEDLDSDEDDLFIVPPADDPHVAKVPDHPLALEFTYGNEDLDKTFLVTFLVRDPTMLSVSGTITVRVTEDMVPELRKPLPDVLMDEDVPNRYAFNLDDFFHDPDHDALYFSYGNKYVRVVIGNDYPHPVSFYPPKDWYGSDTVTFRATDPTGALLEDSIHIKCNSSNDAPEFQDTLALPTLVIHVNSTYHFDLSPYVIDPDHELADLVLMIDSIYVTRSTRMALGIRLLFQQKVERTIDITVIDPEGASDIGRLKVLVTENWPPKMDQPRDVSVKEGETSVKVFNVTNAWDPDWFQEPGTWRDLEYTFISSVAQFHLDWDTGWVDIIPINPDFNTYNGSQNNPQIVILRITDKMGGLREYTFRLTITPVDDAPHVDDIAPIHLSEGTEYIHLVNYVRDVDTPFSTLTFKVQDPHDPTVILSHATMHGSLLVLDYRGAKPGEYEVELWVMDSTNRVNTTITINVKAPATKDEGIPLWTIVLLVAVTGAVAIYASKFVYGRYEPPSVSDVFLVYGDGVIIRHMSKRGSMSMDEDLAIAMLTAIQEFVQQSMRSAQLKSMQAGDNNILIERDPERLFYIAVIHSGTVSEELRKAVNTATRSIREVYGQELRKWDGNIAKFDGVENYLEAVLAISHAHIPEGVRFEMEGIKSIEQGKTFLFQSKDVTRTHRIFRGLVEDVGEGLLISRVHPQRLHPSLLEAGAECVWLSKTPTKRGVSPSNTTMILHEISTFVGEHERTVVCLDGLEYLLVHNPLDEVVAFLGELTDMVQLDNFIMMVHVDPDALDEATLARLARDMVPVSDQKLPNNNH